MRRMVEVKVVDDGGMVEATVEALIDLSEVSLVLPRPPRSMNGKLQEVCYAKLKGTNNFVLVAHSYKEFKTILVEAEVVDLMFGEDDGRTDDSSKKPVRSGKSRTLT